MSIIYEDLGIDYSNAMNNPAEFCSDVHKKAEELRTILKSGSSVSAFLDDMKHKPISRPQSLEAIQAALDDISDIADELPINEVQAVVEMLRKAANDIQYSIRNRAIYELAPTVEDELSKEMAIEQYKRLREVFNQYAKVIKEFDLHETYPIPALTGNFGSRSALQLYVFTPVGEKEGYMNWRQLQKKFGMPEMNLMDTIDYILAHPELKITVSKVSK